MSDSDMEKAYKQGLWSHVRENRFDSKSEEKTCLILNRILKDYQLGELMSIRLTPQQVLDNYVTTNDDKYADYYLNKHKWMKFDFIFEEVYEYKNRMYYIPVCVVEFDGPHHAEPEQKMRDFYKNGVAANIGADMVRIAYDELEHLDEESLRSRYEDEIILGIIRGYLTRTKNFRKQEPLVNEKNLKRFNHLRRVYEEALKNDNENKQYANMLRLLYASEELGYASAN